MTDANDRELVIRPREVIHPDVEIACLRQAVDGEAEDLELRCRRRELGRVDLPLRLEQFG